MSAGDVKGIGVLIETPDGQYLFQERDKHIERNPGAIAPFGGGLEEGESPLDCAVRELEEELELKIVPDQLQDIGLFQSHFSPETYIQMFLAQAISPEGIVLHEGRNIVQMSKKEALDHPLVTDFTKQVLVYMDYTQALKKEGYDPAYTYNAPPGEREEEHVHAYETKLVIMEGEINITTVYEGVITNFNYKAGQEIVIPRSQSHSAKTGANGCRYIVGEKH